MSTPVPYCANAASRSSRAGDCHQRCEALLATPHLLAKVATRKCFTALRLGASAGWMMMEPSLAPKRLTKSVVAEVGGEVIGCNPRLAWARLTRYPRGPKRTVTDPLSSSSWTSTLMSKKSSSTSRCVLLCRDNGPLRNSLQRPCMAAKPSGNIS